jgi:hypothetical protein
LAAPRRGTVNRGKGVGGPCDSGGKVQGLCCSSSAARRGAVTMADQRRPVWPRRGLTTMERVLVAQDNAPPSPCLPHRCAGRHPWRRLLIPDQVGAPTTTGTRGRSSARRCTSRWISSPSLDSRWMAEKLVQARRSIAPPPMDDGAHLRSWRSSGGAASARGVQRRGGEVKSSPSTFSDPPLLPFLAATELDDHVAQNHPKIAEEGKHMDLEEGPRIPCFRQKGGKPNLPNT